MISAAPGQMNDLEPSIVRKFKIIEKVGKGAYGIVYKAFCEERHLIIALKKNFDCYRVATDAQRTYREVKFLKIMRNHENIIKILDVYNAENKQDLYIAFEYMPTDLHAVIRSNMILNEVHMQYITYQILRALKYTHSARIIHRDLKPSNILMDQHCRIKLCDFGLSRFVDEIGDEKHLTDYVATRWYRPPEVLLCSNTYTEGIDIWAVACILGEMMRCIPLLPGNSTLNQVEKILEISDSLDVHRGTKPRISTSPIGQIMLDSVRVHRKVSIEELVFGNGAGDQGEHTTSKRFHKQRHERRNQDTIDFLKKLLAFDPQERYSAEMALSHSFLSDFSSPAYEPDYEGVPIRSQNILNDDKMFSLDRYRFELDAESIKFDDY